MVISISLVIELLAVVMVRMFESRTDPSIWELFATSIQPSVWLAILVVVGNLVAWRWFKADEFKLTPRVFAVVASLLYFSTILIIVVYRISSSTSVSIT